MVASIAREVKAEIRELKGALKDWMKEEVNNLKKEMKKRDDAWKEDKKTTEARIKELERKTEQEIREEEDWRTEMERRIENAEGGGCETEAQSRIAALEKRLEDSERRERKNNILIKGADLNEDNQNSLGEQVKKFMIEKLKVKEQIIRATKIQNRDGNREDIILVELNSLEAKMRIMKARHLLQGTLIYIDDDHTKQQREIQKNSWSSH